MSKKNILTHSKKLKAEQAYQENRLLEAQSLYEAVCKNDRLDAAALARLGTIHRRLGQFQEAERCARQAIALQPRFGEAHSVLGTALQCQGYLGEAVASYQTAVQLDPGSAYAHYLLANILKDTGDTRGAEEHYREAIALVPDYLEALGNLGALYMAQDRMKEALGCLERSLKLNPKAPQVLCNMAVIYEKDGRYGEAHARLQEALLYAPDFVDALATLAVFEEKRHHLNESKALVEKGLKLAPGNVSLTVTAAKIARTEERFQDAIALLESIPRQGMLPNEAGDVCINLGKLYDRVGDAARAFACFAEGNQLIMQGVLSADYDRGGYARKVEYLGTFLTDTLASAKGNAELFKERQPAFLLGFPRSGTTLLEQILDSHPRLQALDERPAVQCMQEEFLRMAGNRTDALASLSDAEIQHLRGIYWETVSRYVKVEEGALLVDKMPLNTVNAHLIWRVFPEAKFILAIRHPADVSLSCFMQSFSLNDAMSVFFTLEETAALYAKVMGFWQKCAQMLPLDYHRIRYEDLVADFEGQARQLLEFLGVGWDDSVLQYNEHAKTRVINTPSYHQVTQPIYQHAKYRWKRYAEQMRPVMPMLEPYIRYFGYVED